MRSGRRRFVLLLLGAVLSFAAAVRPQIATPSLAVARAPAVPAGALAAPQQVVDPVTVIKQAFNILYGGYIYPIPSDVLLRDAWTGVNNALLDAGMAPLSTPAFTGRPESDWPAFATAFQRAARSSGVDPSALEYGAIRQMAQARNSCHTAFLTPLGASEFNGSDVHQPTVDVGFVAGRTNRLVYRVYPGGAGDLAGLRAGDTILTSYGKGAPGILGRIYNADVDERVTVTVQRPGVAEPITLTIVPQVTTLPFIRTQVLPGGVGVIQFDDFTDGPGQVIAIRRALADFEAQGVTGWVLDLRTSPGGSQNGEGAIGSLFVQNGRFTTLIDRNGARQVVEADGVSFVQPQRPLVVLVENYSASAADILPAALQDLGRAHIIGEQSAGCVSSSRLFPLGDGSELQVEVTLVLIGNHQLDLDGVGVTPDETIPWTADQLAAGQDPQLDRAVQYLTSMGQR